jgi:TolB-like protein
MLGFSFLFLAGAGKSQEPAKTSVAVYQLKTSGAADKALGSALTSLLSSKLTSSSRLRVIEEAMLQTVMERQAMNASDACDDTICQVEIGKLVQAQKIITGDIVKLGTKYILSLKLIDIQSGANEFGTEDQCACTEDQLDQLVALAAVKVRNHFGEAMPLPPLPQAANPQASPAGVKSAVAAAIPGPASPGNAVMFLYRKTESSPNKGAITGMPAMPVILDGEFIGQFKVSECIKKDIPAGNHRLQSPFKVPFAKSNDLPFQAAPGGKYFFIGGLISNSVWQYTAVSESEAASWAQTCRDAQTSPAGK